MQDSLLEKISPRLRRLERGGYARKYRDGRRSYGTSLQLAVAGILDAVGVEFQRDVPVAGTRLTADFEANGTYLFVDRDLDRASLARLARGGRRYAIIQREASLGAGVGTGVRVIGLSAPQEGRLQTIFIDDPSFNFDYAHILPRTQKCSVMHGHTSSALVEMVGTTVDGMVIDFGLAKDVVREAVKGLDHKLFIDRRYVTSETRDSVTLSFETVHGPFKITAPKATTVLLDGEATVENLANEVLARVLPGMPENVKAVGVYVYEGLNKGAHLVAQIHRNEVAGARKKR